MDTAGDKEEWMDRWHVMAQGDDALLWLTIQEQMQVLWKENIRKKRISTPDISFQLE